MAKQIIERFGGLTKQEDLITVEDAVLPGTFVLEAIDPFPNYYESFPKSTKPLYVYLVVKKYCPMEDLFRAMQRIKAYFPHRFSATVCCIDLHEHLSAIRIRHLEDYSLISQLQSYFINEGLEMMHKPGRKIKGKGLISLKKFYQFYVEEKGLLLDAEEPDHGYFMLHAPIEWHKFCQVIQNVHNNWTGSRFDGALGYFYYDFSIFDIVRIYNHQMSAEYLAGVKDLFFSEVNKIY